MTPRKLNKENLTFLVIVLLVVIMKVEIFDIKGQKVRQEIRRVIFHRKMNDQVTNLNYIVVVEIELFINNLNLSIIKQAILCRDKVKIIKEKLSNELEKVNLVLVIKIFDHTEKNGHTN